MDCDPSIEVDLDRVALERLCYKLLRRTRTKEEAVAFIENLRYLSSEHGDYKTDSSVEQYLVRLLAQDIKDLLDKEVGAKGVLSLSATWSSPLMWSHYGDQHRGICIEYDTTEVPHPNLGPVNYQSPRSVKASDLSRWKFDNSAEAGRRIYNTYFFAKSPQWKYEREWRDVSETSGVAPTSFRVTAIYFGLRCDIAVISTIVRLLSSEQQIGFYGIYPLDDSFRLRRRRVNEDEVAALAIRPSAILELKNLILPK